MYLEMFLVAIQQLLSLFTEVVQIIIKALVLNVYFVATATETYLQLNLVPKIISMCL